MGSRDPNTIKQVASNIQRIENALKNALTTAQKKGEINQEKDIIALAKFLTFYLQGLQVMSKINPDHNALQELAKVALSVFD